MKRGALALVAVVALVLLAPAAAAEAPQDVANRISEQVMSPFCPGVTLHDCPSDNAIALRAKIARWAARGWSTPRIMSKLLADYPDIRAVPSDKGASLLVWLLPGAAVLAGAIIALLLARDWATPPARREAPPLTADDRRRLEQELALIRGER